MYELRDAPPRRVIAPHVRWLIMTEEELLKICAEFGKSLNKLGDMSDFSEEEILFMYFKGGFEYASRHLTNHSTRTAVGSAKSSERLRED